MLTFDSTVENLMSALRLSLLYICPLIGAVLTSLLPVNLNPLRKKIVLLFSFVPLVIAGEYLIECYNNPTLSYYYEYDWIPTFGIKYALRLDGLNILFVFLTSLLTLVSVHLSDSNIKNYSSYVSALFFLESGLIGSLLSVDLLLFLIFWEALLIPVFLLIGVWGGKRAFYAAMKYLIFSLFGGLLILFAVIYLGVSFKNQFGMYSFLFSDFTKIALTLNEKLLIFSLLFLGFGIKIPIFPFYIWQPTAYQEAEPVSLILIGGMISKVAIYAIIRFLLPIAPEAFDFFGNWIIAVLIFGAIYSGFLALIQKDLRRLAAFSSMSHLNIATIGLFVRSEIAIYGTLFLLISHTLLASGMFFFIRALNVRGGDSLISNYGGLSSKYKSFATSFFLLVIASIAIPFSSSFIGEMAIFAGLFSYSKVYCYVAVFVIVIGSIYMMELYRKICLGKLLKINNFYDLTAEEKIIIFPIIFFIFLFGIFPESIGIILSHVINQLGAYL